MDEMQQAHQELDRLQAIISRHESHMFALRGWLLAIVGGLLAAFYTDSIDMSALLLRIALLTIALLFLLVESRHVNLTEAVVERAEAVEQQITAARGSGKQAQGGWYDGPKVSEACRAGALRWWPRRGMTFLLNLPFYFVVLLIIVMTTLSLPSKRLAEPPPASVTMSPQK